MTFHDSEELRQRRAQENEAHRIIEALEKELLAKYPDAEVFHDEIVVHTKGTSEDE